MSARDLFRLDLPTDSRPAAGDEPPAAADAPKGGDVVRFPGAEAPPAGEKRPGTLERLQSSAEVSVERFATGWRAAWIGDGVLGMRPRPIADLARQFWTAPPLYIRDALILRILYAIYGAAAITVTAAAHLLLLVVSYPSLLFGALLLGLFLRLFL